ncbi:MAG: hypothetical protein M5U12_27175 [Verrucomicrobia bacterium]|nr:hypothetical protein [Verrucomicrobiota bacterium]
MLDATGVVGEVCVGHLAVATARHGPDATVAVRREHIALRHLLLHDLVVRDPRTARSGLEAELRAAAVDVVAIDGPVTLMPGVVLRVDRVAQPAVIARWGRVAEQTFEQDRREARVAFLRQMETVDGERKTGVGGVGVQPLRRGEEVD